VIFRMLTRFFGSDWELKCLCKRTSSPILKNLCITLYGAYQYENGSSIAWNAEFLGEPCFPHGMKSIFISGDSKIGRNCVIFQQVTIGSNALPDSKRAGAPEIGDNCYIGAGAKVIGKIKIGDNVRIGANAVVYEDVPDNSVVLSGEQRIIVKDHALDNRFYRFGGKWECFDDGKYIAVVDERIILKLNEGFDH
jgi:serine O-acetyltransferase